MSYINLIVLRCVDIHRTRRFYEYLNMQFELHRHGSGSEHLGSVNDVGLFLELYPASPANPADRCGLGIGITDLEEAANKLRANGFEPDPMCEKPWGLTFVVRDPEGRRVEVKKELCDNDPEFSSVLEKRIADHDAGVTQAVPADEVFKRFSERK